MQQKQFFTKQSMGFNHHEQWWHWLTGKSLTGANTPKTFQKREKLVTIYAKNPV